jgi:hypothetical protein
MNLAAKIDLTALKDAQVQTAQSGELVLIIPIQRNDLYYSQKGHVYLDLGIWERRGGVDTYGYTHNIQQSLSKAARAALPEGVYPRTLGSAKPIGNQQPSNQLNVMTPQAPQNYVAVNLAQEQNKIKTEPEMPF